MSIEFRAKCLTSFWFWVLVQIDSAALAMATGPDSSVTWLAVGVLLIVWVAVRIFPGQGRGLGKVFRPGQRPNRYLSGALMYHIAQHNDAAWEASRAAFDQKYPN